MRWGRRSTPPATTSARARRRSSSSPSPAPRTSPATTRSTPARSSRPPSPRSSAATNGRTAQPCSPWRSVSASCSSSSRARRPRRHCARATTPRIRQRRPKAPPPRRRRPLPEQELPPRRLTPPEWQQRSRSGAAVCFALAATLQQKGALGEGGVSLAHPASLFRLLRQYWWLAGTGVLFAGYALQAVALDNGRLSVIQPLLVTTIVFALPLGYLITAQRVGRREIAGAAVVVAGLAVFTLVGDPAGGRPNASGGQWAVTIAAVLVLTGVLMALGGGTLERKAGMYGAAAGLLYGLSASLWKPSAELIDAGGVSAAFSSWEI